MARLRYAVVVAAVAGLMVSCASAHGRPWWYQAGVSNCGTPVLVHLHKRVMHVGNCAGGLLIPAPKVTLRVGQQIDIHMAEEPAGPSGKHLVPVYPLPRTTRSSVLVRAYVSTDRATGSYRAIRPGHAVLTTGSRPVIEVTVVS